MNSDLQRFIVETETKDYEILGL